MSDKAEGGEGMTAATNVCWHCGGRGTCNCSTCLSGKPSEKTTACVACQGKANKP